MYSGILYFLFIVCIASAMAVAAGVRIGHTLMPAICLSGIVALVLLVAGVPGACPFVFGGSGIVCAAYTAARIVKDRKNAIYVLTTEIFVFTAFAAICVVLNAGRLYTLNDEFSHWGLAVKNLFLVKELPYGTHTNALFPDYPPFATAISYLGTCFGTVLREDATFIPVDLALAAGFMPVISSYMRACGHKRIPGVGRAFAAVPSVVMIAIMLTFKLSALTVIAVDTLLGAMAFFMVAEAVCGKGRTGVLGAMLTGACLAITKPTGLIFALFASGILLAASIGEGIRSKSFKRFFDLFLKTALPVSLASAAARLVWNVVLVFNKASLSSTHFSVFGRLLKKGFLDGEKDIAAAFLRAFTEPRVVRILPAAAVIAIVAAVNVALLIVLKKKKNDALGITGAMFIGVWIELPVYCFGLFIAYLSEFTREEALEAASFERYLGSFLTYWCWLTAAVIIVVLLPEILKRLVQKTGERPRTDILQKPLSHGRNGKRGIRAVCLAASGVCLAALITFLAAFYPYKKADARRYREAYEESAGIPEAVYALKGNSGDKVLAVSSRYDNKTRLIANYNAAPIKVCGGDGDVSELLRSGDYRFVYFEDGESAERYSEFVTDGYALGNGSVYRVKDGG
ncbi:MAG: hypothetical protein IKX06_04560 [Clostridia bacterium]|nr:hypothetical protein [Clostridia bacterium]